MSFKDQLELAARQANGQTPNTSSNQSNQSFGKGTTTTFEFNGARIVNEGTTGDSQGVPINESTNNH